MGNPELFSSYVCFSKITIFIGHAPSFYHQNFAMNGTIYGYI